MSFMDKLKSLFSGGGSDGADRPAAATEPDIAADMSTGPVDPLGSPMPGAGA